MLAAWLAAEKAAKEKAAKEKAAKEVEAAEKAALQQEAREKAAAEKAARDQEAQRQAEAEDNGSQKRPQIREERELQKQQKQLAKRTGASFTASRDSEGFVPKKVSNKTGLAEQHHWPCFHLRGSICTYALAPDHGPRVQEEAHTMHMHICMA